MVSDNRICKTTEQFSKYPISANDMQKFKEIAIDVCKVKNYVYQKYGGVKSIHKLLYLKYTIQNEMTKCGLREKLGLPSVFYYPAINDALGDIKTYWAAQINKINDNAKNNQNFTDDDRHYIRFVLKFESCYHLIFNGKEPEIDLQYAEKFNKIKENVDTDKLNSYIRRQVRRHQRQLHTENIAGFYVTEKGYRYKDHGIWLSTKENRKRVFIELTDNNSYNRLLYVNLDMENRKVNIKVPIYIKTKLHKDYDGQLGISLGIKNMITTDKGKIYGENYDVYHNNLVKYISTKGAANRRERKNNIGNKKYISGKKCLENTLHNYVNKELNRMIREEKPSVIYIPKLPRRLAMGVYGKFNNGLTLWQRGYITERLELKCRENNIKYVEVFGKNIGKICSLCGAEDFTSENGVYVCNKCKAKMKSRQNAAINALHRGMAE